MQIDLTKLTVPATAVVAIVVGAFSAFFWAEARYALAADVASKSQVQKLEVRLDEQRRQVLEDKIFELELIPEARRTDAQRAMLSRYKAQLDALQRELKK